MNWGEGGRMDIYLKSWYIENAINVVGIAYRE